jgi:3',5'-cyclic AMP phosphodiesterase CpdA
VRIGQLSDFHLLELAARERTGASYARVRYLGARRAFDPAGRVESAREALAAAKDADLDHLVITGDVTEDGHPAQFEIFAELLAACGLDPRRVSIVPGNHDLYGEWERAAAGVLAPWIHGLVDLGTAVIVPVNTAIEQAWTRSSGSVDVAGLAEVLRDLGERMVILAQHHPPFRVAAQWIHGLREHAAQWGLLEASPRVAVVHGHTHKHRDVSIGEASRIFGARSVVVDGAEALRVFSVDAGRLVGVVE